MERSRPSHINIVCSTWKLLVAARDLQAALTDSLTQHAKLQSEENNCRKRFLHGYDVAQSLHIIFRGAVLQSQCILHVMYLRVG